MPIKRQPLLASDRLYQMQMEIDLKQILTMSNELTDIITYIEQNFSRTQATGLNCLIFLSMREQTTVAYQHKEWGFDDIPLQIVNWCDRQDEDVLLELATRITAGLLDDLLETGTQVLYDLLDEVAATALNTKSPQVVLDAAPKLLGDGK